MFYAILNGDGQIARYPYTLTDLKKDNSHISFPPNFPSDPSQLDPFNLVPVNPVEIPAYDEHAYRVVYGDPVESDGVWTETYELVALTAEEKHGFCNYSLFWNSLVNSNLYDFIIEQAASDVRINALSTELATLTAEARAGNSFPTRFQECIWKLTESVSFTEEQMIELNSIFSASNLNLVYSLVRPA